MTLKKISLFFLSLFIICSLFSFSVLAAPTENDTDVSDPTEETSSLTVEDLITEDEYEYGKNSAVQSSFANTILNWLSKGLVSSDEFFSTTFAATKVADAIYKFLFPFGLLILICAWAADLGKKAIDGSLVDIDRGKKNFVNAFLTLLASILVLIISREILLLVDGLMVGLTESVIGVDLSAVKEVQKELIIENGNKFPNHIPIIGYLVGLIEFSSNYFFYIVANHVQMICLLIIVLVIASRTIKIAIYQGFSPLFFGLNAADETKQYFSRFIINYILLSAQILVIAVLLQFYQAANYMIMNGGLVPGFPSHTAAILSIGVNILFTILTCKSSKLLQDMIR